MAFELDWSGFVTEGVARSNTKVPYSGGIDSGLNFTNDFRAGIAGTATFAEDWSLMLQLLSVGKNEDFTVTIDYAALRYQFNSNAAIRLGKIRVNTWLVSEYIDVGTLYPWIRAPIVVYGINPSKSHLGGSASYSYPLPKSSWSLGTEVFGGWAQVEAPSTGSYLDGQLDRLIGVSAFVSNDYLLIRGSYVQTRANIKAVTPTLAASNQGVITAVNVVTPLNLGTARFISGGIRLDWRDILLLSEYARVTADKTLLKEAQGVYATLGYYLWNRKILPHFTFQENFETNNLVSPGTEWSTTLGLNYYINENIVFKSEWQWIHTDGASSFVSDPHKDVHLLGAAVSASF